jgi:hypothetical protein
MFTDRSTHLGNLLVTPKYFPRNVPDDYELYADEEQSCLRPVARPVSADCSIIRQIVSTDGATEHKKLDDTVSAQ